MPHKWISFLSAVLLLSFSARGWAEMIAPMPSGPGPASVVAPLPEPAPGAEPVVAPVAPPPAAPEDPLTVKDVVVDKTDKNAVIARDLAIAEAQRAALQKLAERSMTPEAFKSFRLPDDQTITTLVQDFQIRNEQLSANRYVASFTVRFNEGVSAYISSSAPAPEAPAALPDAAVSRDVLVLPYFEDISGRKLLWEDPNPWREAWQETGNSTPAVGLTVTVPMGDLADVASGSSEAVWLGDFSAIEKLRVNYAANEVALAVANKSGVAIRVDLYIYKDGRLERKKTVTPHIGAAEGREFFAQAVAQVVGAIRSPLPYQDAPPLPVEAPFISQKPELEPSRRVAAPVPSQPPFPPSQTPAPPARMSVQATMRFNHFTQWLEVQRRLASLTPIPVVELSGLSKNTAKFTLTFDGGLEAFQSALAGKELVLEKPAVEVDEAALDKSKGPQRPLYELKLSTGSADDKARTAPF